MSASTKSTVKSASDGKKISAGLVRFHLKAKAPRRIEIKRQMRERAEKEVEEAKE